MPFPIIENKEGTGLEQEWSLENNVHIFPELDIFELNPRMTNEVGFDDHSICVLNVEELMANTIHNSNTKFVTILMTPVNTPIGIFCGVKNLFFQIFLYMTRLFLVFGYAQNFPLDG